MLVYDRKEERTGVQEANAHSRKIHLGCDFVMVYGINDTLEERIKSFKDRGYGIHLMTGVAWGAYDDYLTGGFDGRTHWDEAQVLRDNGRRKNHVQTPYMVPTVAFADYLSGKLKRAVDAGVEAIHLEEPEFWVDTGYSDAFKREWEIFYHEPWQDPLITADAQYRASKLKARVYARTLDRLSSELKEYAKIKHKRDLRFYVPTHSLVNYTHWRIVSPEAALIDIPGVDGFIAQIWTGTARTQNRFTGVKKERTFETAFLEYGVMQELVRGTGKRMWFLHDPVEDDPKHDWDDYKNNYFRTVAASLFHPEIYHYEVSPWPSRVMNGRYPARQEGVVPKPIPPEYATNLLTIMHTLRDMKQPDVRFDRKMDTVGVFIADSAMYQRAVTDDHPLKNQPNEWEEIVFFDPFYGLCLPLLKNGLAVRPVQLDNVRRYPDYLDAYETLVLSYEFFKPEHPDVHNAIANWVKKGGALVYVGDGSDPYHRIRHWWTAHGYADPSQHLMECLGLDPTFTNGFARAGKGLVCHLKTAPCAIAKEKTKTLEYLAFMDKVFAEKGTAWEKHPSIVLRRGKYVVTAVMDEAECAREKTLPGRYMDLFTHDLRIVENPVLAVGSVGLYMDMAALQPAENEVLAISARADKFESGETCFAFTAEGPEGVLCACRVRTAFEPACVAMDTKGGKQRLAFTHDRISKTTFFTFPNDPDGVRVTVCNGEKTGA